MKRRNVTIPSMAVLLIVAGAAHADPPPADTHADDFLLGRLTDCGTAGIGSALWFSDCDQNPTRIDDWFASSRTLIPNIAGPTGTTLYYNLGSNVVTYYDETLARNQNVLSSATLQADSLTPGLEVFKTQYRFFASDPAITALYPSGHGNTFNYPYTSTWHNHFGVRAFKPGAYQFRFHLTNVVARDGTPLPDSKIYTLMLKNQPVLSGTVNLAGWARTDTTPYRIGNVVRLFVFPADSTPTKENQAVTDSLGGPGYTDVFLDANGNFQMPEQLVPDGNYRIGLKPLTAAGVAKLLPGNVALSADTPPTLPALTPAIGDANRDGVIDDADINQVVQNNGKTPATAGYAADSDANGDGVVNATDFQLVVHNAGAASDFTP